MSERGSFVTEFLYCEKCLEAIKPILLCNDKFLMSIEIPMWSGEDSGRATLPIIAGKIGGMGSGDELLDMEFEYGRQIEKVICHPVRLAVLADSGGGKIFTFNPGGV